MAAQLNRHFRLLRLLLNIAYFVLVVLSQILDLVSRPLACFGWCHVCLPSKLAAMWMRGSSLRALE
jgi:hypothetical protein